MLLRLRRDPLDRHRPERTAVSFLASTLVHALIALLLFSVLTSSSEQAPESISGGVIMTVSSLPVPTSAPVSAAKVAVPVPHAPVVPKTRALTQPRSAPPHPRVLHELSKFAPTAPPNPTPAPQSSLAPNPIPTQAVIAVSPAPLPAQVPTSVPTAAVIAASIRIPPTPAPIPKPSVAPTQVPRTPQPQPSAAPKAPAATPLPQPSVIAVTAAPIVAMPSPVPISSPGIVSHVKIAARPQQHGTAPTPGPKAVASAGPRGVAPVKTAAMPRPLQPLPATPHPAPVRVTRKLHPTLNQRLQSLIPTAAPSFSPAPLKRYSGIGSIMPTPLPQPTPPPQVLAATKFLYVENVGAQRWKQSWLGTAPEEAYVKMYVTSVKRIGFINWCKGWVVRMPVSDAEHVHWIVEPDQSFICSGHLEPFTPPSPLPNSGA